MHLPALPPFWHALPGQQGSTPGHGPAGNEEPFGKQQLPPMLASVKKGRMAGGSQAIGQQHADAPIVQAWPGAAQPPPCVHAPLSGGGAESGGPASLPPSVGGGQPPGGQHSPALQPVVHSQPSPEGFARSLLQSEAPVVH